MYCIEVVHNGGVNCGGGGHPLRRVYCCAFLGLILGAFKVYHRQNLKILINVLNVKCTQVVKNEEHNYKGLLMGVLLQVYGTCLNALIKFPTLDQEEMD